MGTTIQTSMDQKGTDTAKTDLQTWTTKITLVPPYTHTSPWVAGSMTRSLGFISPTFLFLIFREKGREGDRKGKKHQCERDTLAGFLPYTPSLGNRSATQACTLTRNQTSGLSVCGMISNQPSHTSWKHFSHFSVEGETNCSEILLWTFSESKVQILTFRNLNCWHFTLQPRTHICILIEMMVFVFYFILSYFIFKINEDTCYGWIVSPPKFMYWSSNPKYLRSDLIWIWCLYRSQVKVRSLEWALIQYDWCPYKKRKCGLLEHEFQCLAFLSEQHELQHLLQLLNKLLPLAGQQCGQSLCWFWGFRLQEFCVPFHQHVGCLRSEAWLWGWPRA